MTLGRSGPDVDERTALWVAWTLAAIGFLAQMLTNGRYGYFRDELYFLAASHHLAAGYVDFAPLIAWLARGSRMIFGKSLHAIRLLPALAFAAEIALTGFLTLELGGKKCAVLVACVCVLIAPVILHGLFPAGENFRHKTADLEKIRAAVLDKDLYWFNRYRTVDGYNVYGGRSQLKFVDGVRNWDILQREMEVLMRTRQQSPADSERRPAPTAAPPVRSLDGTRPNGLATRHAAQISSRRGFGVLFCRSRST